jgi:hypothetical protein
MMKIEWLERGEGEYPDLQAFRDMHRTADVIAIDDVDCHGFCEGCKEPILGDDFGYADYYGEDNVWICTQCQEDTK